MDLWKETIQNLELVLYSANTNMALLQLPAPQRIFQMQTFKWLFAVSFMLVQSQLTLTLKLLQLTVVVVRLTEYALLLCLFHFEREVVVTQEEMSATS